MIKTFMCKDLDLNFRCISYLKLWKTNGIFFICHILIMYSNRLAVDEINLFFLFLQILLSNDIKPFGSSYVNNGILVIILENKRIVCKRRLFHYLKIRTEGIDWFIRFFMEHRGIRNWLGLCFIGDVRFSSHIFGRNELSRGCNEKRSSAVHRICVLIR